MVKQALISVSDKNGVVDFARTLAGLGYRLLSTGGTAQILASAGLDVTEVATYTGFPEILDGRVKTLNPRIHAGLLARRGDPAHMAALAQHGIDAIDILAVNLYPFEQTVARPGCAFDDAIENIDIGGPAMLRAAAKNHECVAVVVDPADYGRIADELKSRGAIDAATRLALAKKVFTHTARYDGAIANYLTALDDDGKRGLFPAVLSRQWVKVQQMRYGENPHQQAAFYRERDVAAGLLSGYTQLQGKELSYNNIADADAAWDCARSFNEPACAIVKHANPCGVATAQSAAEAYAKAFKTDPTSAFGGIIAFNRPVDAAAAAAVARQFVEVVIAPEFDAAARAVFAAKQNVRLLTVPLGDAQNDLDFKRVGGGLLAQTPDTDAITAADLKIVTARVPTAAETEDLLFAWRVARFVKSNTIVFARDGMTLGIGAGQMSRIDSARIASVKAKEAGLSLAGAAAASDAFFPFRDGLDVVVDAGATCVIQPGGSVRDEEVIAAANERGVAMVFTGARHFRH
jgi:phosphoribosylaminoimidazolecarboxamide formyltransferase/IMP cyclohydrolase